MLSDEEIEEIESYVEEYPTRRGACVDALKVVQRHHGWVDDERLEAVADLLEMTPEEVDSLATFYNLIYRKPVGEHVVLVCNSVSCWLCGYEQVSGALCDELDVELGQTSEDGQFTVIPTACLGDCDHAPVMMVDEDTHHDLSAEGVAEILASYRDDAGQE